MTASADEVVVDDMVADDEPDGALRHDRLGSVRVRITLVAALVTAMAVALAGVLLTRSVEDTQIGRIHDDIEGRVAAVAQRLSDGADLRSAVQGFPMVRVQDGEGNLLMSNPVTYRLPDGSIQQVFIGEEAPGDAGDGPMDETGPSVALGIEGGLGEVIQQGGAPPGQGQGDDQGEDQGEDQNGDPNGDRGLTVVARTSASGAEEVTRQVDTQRYGALTITAFAPVDEVARSVSAVSRALWLLLPALVGVVALVAWWLVGRALRPVEAIRRQAESIEGATIHRRLPEPTSDDEIGRLARTMNAMLGRLDRSAQRQRQFVSDASHELRSPVAAIRTDLEVALHEGDRADWPTVARAVLAEEGRLETLLADLLVLAADEEAASASSPGATVDVARLAQDEVARGRRVPVRLELDPEDPGDDEMVVEGVAARLDRALANLVDNAARHAREEVRVTICRKGDRVRAVVDDDGPGIPVADRERIFERFARLDGSRARDRGGAGLGLAVVRSIATRHDGCVWADASPLGGARFILDLPAARPEPA